MVCPHQTFSPALFYSVSNACQGELASKNTVKSGETTFCCKQFSIINRLFRISKCAATLFGSLRYKELALWPVLSAMPMANSGNFVVLFTKIRSLKKKNKKKKFGIRQIWWKVNGQNTILDADPITSYIDNRNKRGKKGITNNLHSKLTLLCTVYLYFTPLIHNVVAQMIGVQH